MVDPARPDPVIDEVEARRELDCLLTIGDIAGKVAHEINNPLAGIQNAFLLIKDAIPASHRHYAYVAAIEREIQRIAAVTRRLSETYRPEQDRATDVAVSTIVGDAIRLAGWTGGAPFAVMSPVPRAWPAPAGLLRHTLHRVFESVVRAADPVEPIVVDTTMDDATLRVHLEYRPVPGAPDVAAPSRYATVLAGVCDLTKANSGMCEFTLRVPVPNREAAVA